MKFKIPEILFDSVVIFTYWYIGLQPLWKSYPKISRNKYSYKENDILFKLFTQKLENK